MKTLPLVSLLALLAVGAGAGCESMPNNQKVATAVKVAAYTGTAVGLQEHPEWRPGFEDAHRGLLVIEKAETIDFATLMVVVQRLPIKELKSDKAVILITSATILLQDWGGALPLDQLEQLRPVVKAMREGIELGLSVSAQPTQSGTTNVLRKVNL